MSAAERPLTFAQRHHDRAAERRRDAEWLEAQWHSEHTRVLAVHQGSVEVDDEGSPRWATPKDAPPGDRYLLGIDERGFARYAVDTGHVRQDVRYRGLRELVPFAHADDSDWLCHAVALAQWHSTHTHCPRCGTPTEVAAAGAERLCPADGSAHFPRVDPAVIVLVTDQTDRALLGRQEAWPVGRFSTLAGFVEPGETVEQAVAREVGEESGIRVHEVRMLASQPWPFPSSLMLGAEATVVGSPEPVPDGAELEEVRWFSRDDLRDAVAEGSVMVPGSISISRWLIDRWYGGDLPDDDAGWR
ncbi:MAG TPA: NAD(+) diphosphatase [Actinomycetes bacterium]|nr:NAD(+) diphosphatase [Actinomycetes bacterium]